MANPASWTRRADELAASLAGRAQRCPGLYPFSRPDEFLELAALELGSITSTKALCLLLEAWNRHPSTLSECLQHHQNLANQDFTPRVVTTTAAEETAIEASRRSSLITGRKETNREAA